MNIRLEILLLASFLVGLNICSWAQTDDPCGSPLLNVDSTCVYSTANITAGATYDGSATGFGGGSCNFGLHPDMWMSFVAPASGGVSITTVAGSIVDAVMAVFSADCAGNYTELVCSDDVNGLMPAAPLLAVTPGETYYIALWDYGGGSGTLDICVEDNPNAGPCTIGGANSSCATAEPFCTGSNYNFCNTINAANAFGPISCDNVDSLGASFATTVFTSPNPAFYFLEVDDPGDIHLDIAQYDNAGMGIDVDFVLWGPFANIASACTPINANPQNNLVDCSYSGSFTEQANIFGAQTGEVYMLMLTNFSNSDGNMVFSQSGGAGSTNCSIICNVAIDSANATDETCDGLNDGQLDLVILGTDTYNIALNSTLYFDSILAGSYTIDSLAPGGYDVIVTSTSDSTCADTVNIVIFPGPSLDASYSYPALTYCLSDPNPIATISGTAGGVFTIANNGVIDPNTGEVNIIASGAGSFDITYSLTGVCAIDSTVTLVITSAADATISPNPTGPYCPSDAAVQLTGADPGGIWSGSGVDANGLFNPALANIDTNQIIYTINNSCGDTDTISIIVNSAFDATISPNSTGPYCASDAPIQLNGVDTVGIWSGTGVDANGLFDPALALIGNNEIIYTINGACGDTDSIAIVVNANEDAGFAYPVTSYCLTDPNPTPIVSGTSGGTFTINNSGVVDATTGLVDIAASGGGTFDITYTTGGACSSDSTFSLIFTNQTDATISPNTFGVICIGDPVIQLSGVDAGGTWSGTAVNSSGSFNPAAANIGANQIIYTISGNCGDADTINIDVFDVANATITPPITGPYCPSDPPIQLITVDPGGVWTGGGISANGIFNPANAVLGYNQVIYTISSASCGDADTLIVLIECENHLWFPNSFSPNGDGQNDLYTAITSGAVVQEFEFRIFDRWGREVFNTPDPRVSWNGKDMSGNYCPDGVYVYSVSYKLEGDIRKTSFKSHVTLLR